MAALNALDVWSVIVQASQDEDCDDNCVAGLRTVNALMRIARCLHPYVSFVEYCRGYPARLVGVVTRMHDYVVETVRRRAIHIYVPEESRLDDWTCSLVPLRKASALLAYLVVYDPQAARRFYSCVPLAYDCRVICWVLSKMSLDSLAWFEPQVDAVVDSLALVTRRPRLFALRALAKCSPLAAVPQFCLLVADSFANFWTESTYHGVRMNVLALRSPNDEFALTDTQWKKADCLARTCTPALLARVFAQGCASMASMVDVVYGEWCRRVPAFVYERLSDETLARVPYDILFKDVLRSVSVDQVLRIMPRIPLRASRASVSEPPFMMTGAATATQVVLFYLFMLRTLPGRPGRVLYVFGQDGDSARRCLAHPDDEDWSLADWHTSAEFWDAMLQAPFSPTESSELVALVPTCPLVSLYEMRIRLLRCFLRLCHATRSSTAASAIQRYFPNIVRLSRSVVQADGPPGILAILSEVYPTPLSSSSLPMRDIDVARRIHIWRIAHEARTEEQWFPRWAVFFDESGCTPKHVFVAGRGTCSVPDILFFIRTFLRPLQWSDIYCSSAYTTNVADFALIVDAIADVSDTNPDDSFWSAISFVLSHSSLSKSTIFALVGILVRKRLSSRAVLHWHIGSTSSPSPPAMSHDVLLLAKNIAPKHFVSVLVHLGVDWHTIYKVLVSLKRVQAKHVYALCSLFVKHVPHKNCDLPHSILSYRGFSKPHMLFYRYIRTTNWLALSDDEHARLWHGFLFDGTTQPTQESRYSILCTCLGRMRFPVQRIVIRAALSSPLGSRRTPDTEYEEALNRYLRVSTST